MKRVFLSYRRADTRDIAGRLYDRLTSALGCGHVFRDVDSIPLGIDFQRVLDEEVGRCEIFLVIIGPRWLELTDASGLRRLDNAGDFVRIEIESALARGLPVILVRADDTSMPEIESLPPSLASLAECASFPLRHDPDFDHDVSVLLEAVSAAPIVGKRTATPAEQWVDALSRALRRALIGEFAGVFVGIACAACFWRLLQMMGPRGMGPDALQVVVFGSVGIFGGAAVGGRRFGKVGVILGAVAGAISWFALAFLLFLFTCVVGLTFFIPLALVGGLLTAGIRYLLHGKGAGFEVDKTTLQMLMLSALAGFLLAILPSAILAMRGCARQLALRERVHFNKIKTTLGTIAGGACGATGVLVPAAVLAGFGLLPAASESFARTSVFVVFTAVLTGLFAAGDVLIGHWRR